MGFAVSLTRFTQYVQVAVAGPAAMKSFVELVETMGQETLFWSDRRVLVDLRDVEGALNPTEQVFLGELVAQDLPHLERIASVVPADRITRNSETAAQDLGMRLRVFTSKDEAIAWLTAEVPRSMPKPATASTHPGDLPIV
ncbi:MAG TPA: STAS/SEC14 domain-containing protein [Ramlibacter sp.]|nr:STAS/SEC14 domain-containing protein [Ramlibacter sp.]